MKMFEAIRKLFTFEPDVGCQRNWRLYLRRGTLEEISKATPYHVGELIICTDFPVMCVGSAMEPGGYERINLSKPARDALIAHYNEDYQQLNWREED